MKIISETNWPQLFLKFVLLILATSLFYTFIDFDSSLNLRRLFPDLTPPQDVTDQYTECINEYNEGIANLKIPLVPTDPSDYEAFNRYYAAILKYDAEGVNLSNGLINCLNSVFGNNAIFIKRLP